MKPKIILFVLLFVTAGLVADELDYPPSYRDLGLPEYQNAKVTGLGRDNTSLHDGISVTLFTTDDGPVLRSYYEAEMNSRGWILQETVASKKMRAAGMLDALPFGAVFTKDGMQYQLFTNPEGDGTAIHITVNGE